MARRPGCRGSPPRGLALFPLVPRDRDRRVTMRAGSAGKDCAGSPRGSRGCPCACSRASSRS
eukprot:4660674-Lingulodinium_polyedra.AAC.1